MTVAISLGKALGDVLNSIDNILDNVLLIHEVAKNQDRGKQDSDKLEREAQHLRRVAVTEIQEYQSQVLKCSRTVNA